jgi:hypothetical protein
MPKSQYTRHAQHPTRESKPARHYRVQHISPPDPAVEYCTTPPREGLPVGRQGPRVRQLWMVTIGYSW